MMTNRSTVSSPAQKLKLTRRGFLNSAGAASLVLTGSLSPISTAFADSLSPDDFIKLSEFLTGKAPLNPQLSSRFYMALGKKDPQFFSAAEQLWASIQTAKLANMDAFLAQSPLNTALFTTAKTIVSAWYTGVVGRDEKSELISYADALMYIPSRDVLVIPSYGAGPDAWGAKPPASAL